MTADFDALRDTMRKELREAMEDQYRNGIGLCCSVIDQIAAHMKTVEHPAVVPHIERWLTATTNWLRWESATYRLPEEDD